ncbi:hypothetical protein M405DRAFT_868260 [Rhizopogon salebrosus TDB-379]|nr:hypothetical protein M405DRAFT_868260 [Rhizopogon salebrosus TDB-379]
MFKLIATGSSPLSRVHNDLALSPLSNNSPTAIAFAEARAGHFFRLLSDANERPRGHFQRQIQVCKTLTLSGGTSSAKDVHRPSMDIRKKASVGSV